MEELARQRIVKSQTDGTTHSQIPKRRGDTKSNPVHFNGAEPISTLIPSDGQYPPISAKIIQTNDLPFREGIGPHTHTPKSNTIATDVITHEIQGEPPQISSDKSRGGGGSPCINARKREGGATCLEAGVHDFRDLRGRDISGTSGGEENHLPNFQGPGESPQTRKVGYRPMVDGKPVPGTPRKEGANAK
jgi:hypothetical protein